MFRWKHIFKCAFQSRCQSEADCNCVTWMHTQDVSYPTKIENHIRSLWINFYANFKIRLQNQKYHPLGYNHLYSRQSVVWRQDWLPQIGEIMPTAQSQWQIVRQSQPQLLLWQHPQLLPLLWHYLHLQPMVRRFEILRCRLIYWNGKFVTPAQLIQTRRRGKTDFGEKRVAARPGQGY